MSESNRIRQKSLSHTSSVKPRDQADGANSVTKSNSQFPIPETGHFSTLPKDVLKNARIAFNAPDSPISEDLLRQGLTKISIYEEKESGRRRLSKDEIEGMLKKFNGTSDPQIKRTENTSDLQHLQNCFENEKHGEALNSQFKRYFLNGNRPILEVLENWGLENKLDINPIYNHFLEIFEIINGSNSKNNLDIDLICLKQSFFKVFADTEKSGDLAVELFSEVEKKYKELLPLQVPQQISQNAPVNFSEQKVELDANAWTETVPTSLPSTLPESQNPSASSSKDKLDNTKAPVSSRAHSGVLGRELLQRKINHLLHGKNLVPGSTNLKKLLKQAGAALRNEFKDYVSKITQQVASKLHQIGSQIADKNDEEFAKIAVKVLVDVVGENTAQIPPQLQQFLNGIDDSHLKIADQVGADLLVRDMLLPALAQALLSSESEETQTQLLHQMQAAYTQSSNNSDFAPNQSIQIEQVISKSPQPQEINQNAIEDFTKKYLSISDVKIIFGFLRSKNSNSKIDLEVLETILPSIKKSFEDNIKIIDLSLKVLMQTELDEILLRSIEAVIKTHPDPLNNINAANTFFVSIFGNKEAIGKFFSDDAAKAYKDKKDKKQDQLVNQRQKALITFASSEQMQEEIKAEFLKLITDSPDFKTRTFRNEDEFKEILLKTIENKAGPHMNTALAEKHFEENKTQIKFPLSFQEKRNKNTNERKAALESKGNDIRKIVRDNFKKTVKNHKEYENRALTEEELVTIWNSIVTKQNEVTAKGLLN